MAKRWGLLIVVAMASAAAGADPPRPARERIERKAEFVARVDAAIDRGTEWLKRTQAADGSFGDFPGYEGAVTALAYHTMRVCGVAREDRAAVNAWEAMRAAYRKQGLKTYAAALFLMAIAEHGDRVASAQDDHDVRLGAEDAAW